MSDSPADFRRKTEKMFAEAEARLDRAGRLFIEKVAEQAIVTTPGPGLQLPETEYVATGQLRGGWKWGLAAPEVASVWEGGPTSESGAEPLAQIRAAVEAEPLPRMSYLWTDVAYGYLVHEGRGRHPYPRPWVALVATPSSLQALAAEAIAEAK